MEVDSWVTAIYPVSYNMFCTVNATWTGDGTGYAWIQTTESTTTSVKICVHEVHAYPYTTPCHVIAIGY